MSAMYSATRATLMVQSARRDSACCARRDSAFRIRGQLLQGETSPANDVIDEHLGCGRLPLSVVFFVCFSRASSLVVV